jgi:ferrochelatase
LLIQLGTPDAPTTPALRRYLRQFLGDPRVIEVPPYRWGWLNRLFPPRLRWGLVLNLFILPFRPARSAAKYQLIWDPVTGSPLLHHTRRQAESLQQLLPGVPVRFGMQIGNPALGTVVEEMLGAGVERLIVLPMYPQYSATTSASATDALFHALMRQRRVPALRIVPPYYDHPGYLDALAGIIRAELARLPWQPEHHLISFHGIPIRYARSGDPYTTQVKRTTAKLVERLGWERSRWTQTFQSLFGREEWLKPYTEHKLVELARKGVKRVFVALPGFTADCLETIDEIGREALEAFRHAGGELLHRCPCLNEDSAWIETMRQLILQEGQGWL